MESCLDPRSEHTHYQTSDASSKRRPERRNRDSFLGRLLRLNRCLRYNQSARVAPILAGESVLHGARHVDAIQGSGRVLTFRPLHLAITLHEARVVGPVDEGLGLSTAGRQNWEGNTGLSDPLREVA